MTRTFIQTLEFSKNWDELNYTDDDLQKLEKNILYNPTEYPVIKGTGGLRKMRFALDHYGKRGGVRVCYIDFPKYETVYLITVYPKNVKDNLSLAEKREIKRWVAYLEQELEESL
jgi:hypothetical protein